jgi:hypothetical protein
MTNSQDLLKVARKAYQETQEPRFKRVEAIKAVYSVQKARRGGLPTTIQEVPGLKAAKDWVDSHWREVTDGVTLYDEEEALTEDGRQIYLKVEREVRSMLEEITRGGGLTVREAMGLLTEAVGTAGGRLILENRREKSKS